MRITLIDNLTIIAHSQHSNQNGDVLAKIFVIMPYIQYLSLLLPQHGWLYWKYSDGYLSFLQKASSYFTITPFFEFQSSFIYYPFTIFSLIIMIGLILYLSFYSLELESEDNKGKYQEGRTSTLCSIIMFTIQTLQIPCYKFYIQQIIEAKQNNQQSQLIVNIITIIFYCIFIFMNEYFLRQYSFTPYHPMQQKFTKLRVSQIILNLVAIILTLDRNSHLFNMIGLLILHLIFILKMLNHLYYKPESPQKNIIHFEISLTLECLAILITVNVASENTIFPEKQMGIYIMFIFSLSLMVGNLLFSTLLQLNFNYKIKLLYQIYEIYSYIQEINSSSITTNHLLIFQTINSTSLLKFKNKMIQNNKSQKMFDYYKLGLSLITEIFICLKEQSKNNIEETQLLFISFLALNRNKPLIGYVEFKKFEQNENFSKSYYFQLIKFRIDLNLQKKITLIQQIYEKEQILSRKNLDEKCLNIKEFYQFCAVEEKFQKKVQDLVQLKISIWEYQIQGCKTIYDYENFACKLSKKIVECIFFLRKYQINVIKEEFIKTNDNVLILKICSLFHSFVLNDYFSSFLCEQKISEISKFETSLEQNIITRASVLQDKTVLVVVSVVKQLGQIINKNKNQIANYFGYTATQFSQIQNVKELMPPYFGEQHDQFLSTYIKEAKTNLAFKEIITFALDRNGFIIPQYITVSNNFTVKDDFTLIGSLTKQREIHNYLIFDEFGRCIGLTQQLCKTIVPYDCQEYFLQNLDLFYVYMFLPHIHIYMNDILQNQNNETTIQQKSVLLYVFTDLIEVSKIHQKIMNQYQQQSEPAIEKTNMFSQYEQMNSLITSPRNGVKNQLIVDKQQQVNKSEEYKNLELSSMDFFNIGKNPNPPQHCTIQYNEPQKKENEIIEFLNAIEVLQKNIFLCTAKIQMAKLGNGKIQQNYFILELFDFIDKSNFQEEEKRQVRKQNQLVRKAVKRHSSYKASYVQTFQQIPKNPDLQADNSLQSPVGSALQKKSLLERSPAHNQILSYLSERRVNIMGVIGSLNSDSFSEEIFSNEAHDVYQHQNDYKSNPVGLHQSQSSGKSGASGQTAIEIVNKFKKKTSLISSLAIICIIKFVIILLFSIFLSINLSQITIYNNQVIQFISDINLPINLNKYFLNVFTYSWITSLRIYGVLNSSQYIYNEMMKQDESMKTTFLNLSNMYGNFIQLEQAGYIQDLNITHIDSQINVQNVEYTDYIYYLEQIGYSLLHFDTDERFLTNLLKYRINFHNIIINNQKVINSLSNYYSDQQTSKLFVLFNQVLIEAIVISIIFVSQIIFWKKLEQYCQRILMLSNRLTEKSAENQIFKFKLISQVMKQTFGEIGYKQQNCYKLCYQEIQKKSNKKNYKLRQSKLQSLSSTLMKQQSEKKVENQKKSNLTTIPLNSRIINTQVNITIKIILVIFSVISTLLFLMGDYLLFKSQSLELDPTSEMAMDYIQFYVDFENNIALALLSKSEQQIYKIIDNYTTENMNIMQQFEINENTAKLLVESYNFNHSDLNEIYTKIINSDVINGADENVILGLYNQNFCLFFSEDQIPFCNNSITQTQFAAKYGNYYPKDNNSDYLAEGLIGIVSRVDNFYRQYFEYEISNLKLNKDLTFLNQQINSQQFNNIIIQHYLDTYLGFEEFIAKIQDCTIKLIVSQQQIFYFYQLAFGLFLLIFFALLIGCIIIKVNLRLIYIRLLITLLPIDVMLDIYTISLLKILR